MLNVQERGEAAVIWQNVEILKSDEDQTNDLHIDEVFVGYSEHTSHFVGNYTQDSKNVDTK